MSLFSGWFKKTVKIEDAVSQAVAALKKTVGSELVGVLLYGPAVQPEGAKAASTADLLVVLKRLDAATLSKLKVSAKVWEKSGIIKALFLGMRELKGSASAFPLEFLDMQENHRVLLGEDPLRRLVVDKKNLRHQLATGVKSKLGHFRRRYLAGEASKLLIAELMVALLVDFKALLRLKRNRPARQRVRVIEDTCRYYRLNRRVFLQAHDLHWRGKSFSDADLVRLFENMLGELERLSETVDKMQAEDVPFEGAAEEERGGRERSGRGGRDRSGKDREGRGGRDRFNSGTRSDLGHRKDLVNAVKTLINEIPNRKKWEPKETERFQTDEQGRDAAQAVDLRFGWDREWLRFKVGKGEAPTVTRAAAEAKEKEEEQKQKEALEAEDRAEESKNLSSEVQRAPEEKIAAAALPEEKLSGGSQPQIQIPAKASEERASQGLNEKTRTINKMNRSVAPRSRREKAGVSNLEKEEKVAVAPVKTDSGVADRLPEEKFNW